MTERLRSDLKKKQPFPNAEQAVIVGLLRTADRVNLQIERLMRAHGLTGSQYNVLRILRGEGAPLPMTEIAARTLQALPGITGLIDRLEKSGWVRRRRCEHDRRVIYIEITPAGLERLRQLDAPLPELERRLLSRLTSAQLQDLSQLLEGVREGVAVAEQAGGD